MRYFFIALLALSFAACKENKPHSEVGIQLPPNVIENVELRYAPDKSGKEKVKKAVYIDTTSNEKVAERHFYESQKIYIENLFKSGRKNGPSMAFRDSTGKPWSMHTYTNDTLDGPYKVWHENGFLRLEGQYKMGKKIGNWRFFDNTGQVVKEINFDDPANQNIPGL
ncbi:MAG: toxin-antitoxin system YwqK family antitoxin [Flavobacteriales bacterium]|jgi:antitoxin component YwqK of YwqJK toxin-antitoxin module